MIILILIILGIIILFALENYNHDCIKGKKCSLSVEPPVDTLPNKEFIQRLTEMLRSTYSYSFWRQSLLVALIVVLPIVFVVKRDLPNWFDFILITGIVFVAVYFSYSWLWTHFIFPNCQNIESALRILSRKL